MDSGGLFDWDEGNEEHIARHGIEPYEAEEALLDPKRVGTIGATAAGRILAVVFTRREGKTRPIMARNATDKEKRRYRR
ncbi:MAG: BrnT family toxin [Rubrobacteraceae bacterium]